MSLAKGLHVGQILIPDLEILGALIKCRLRRGHPPRAGRRPGVPLRLPDPARDLVIGALAALAALGSATCRTRASPRGSLAGFATGGILIVAGGAVLASSGPTPIPRRVLPRHLARPLGRAPGRVGRFPGRTGHRAPPHDAPRFMLFYFLSTFAIIIMVLDRARSETATLKEFNERLVDGLGEGLQLVDGDFRIRHANRWMHGLFGPVVGRRCYELLAADAMPCPGCPLDRRHGIDDAVRIEVAGSGGRRFSLSCSPVRQPDGQIFLLELVADVTERERLQARHHRGRAPGRGGRARRECRARDPQPAGPPSSNATTLLGEEETLTREERANTLARSRRRRGGSNRILSDFLVFARPRESKPLDADIRVVVDHVAGPDPGGSRSRRAVCSYLGGGSIPPCPAFPFERRSDHPGALEHQR